MKREDFPLRRLLVALDSSTPSLVALAAAVELAARLRAEVNGVFVEDENLFRLAGLPGAREFRLPTGTARDLREADLQAEMRAQAARARQILGQAAERGRIPCNFHLRRGPVTAEILAAAEDADLLVLGANSRPLGPVKGLGGTARAALLRAPGSVLVVPKGMAGVRGVALAYDGSHGARRAMAAAAVLTEQVAEHLTVLLLAESVEGILALEERAGVWLKEQGLTALFRPVLGAASAPERVLAVARTLPDAMMVVAAGTPPMLDEPRSMEALASLDMPLLVTR